MHGIPVFTDDGERVGMSTRAAGKAIAQVVVSRVSMATPGMRKFCSCILYIIPISLLSAHTDVQISC